MEKIMLGTSDAWLLSHFFHPPSKSAYFIGDCRIFRLLDDLGNIDHSGKYGERTAYNLEEQK